MFSKLMATFVISSLIGISAFASVERSLSSDQMSGVSQDLKKVALTNANETSFENVLYKNMLGINTFELRKQLIAKNAAPARQINSK